jgi:hypothetical protein
VLLVSVCNPATEAQSTLLQADPLSWAITPLYSTTGFGATGICRLGDDLFIGSQSPEATVTVLDARTLSVRNKTRMPGARDLHSLAAWEGGVAVASSGTDEVLWYRYDGTQFVERTVLWAASSSKTDTLHVNGLAAYGGRLVCCAFGRRFREFDVWSQRQDGFIYDITGERFVLQGLARPHTVVFHDGQLYVCESSRRNLRSAERSLLTFDGFTRGAAWLDDGRVVVASSRARTRSRSTGELIDPETVGRYAGTSALHVADLDGTIHESVSLADYGREIYDVFRLS